MTILLLFTALVIIWFLTRANRKKRCLVKVATESKGTNRSVITIDLDTKELSKRVKNGNLGTGMRNQKRSIDDIAGFYGTSEYSQNKEYAIHYCDSFHENGKLINGEIALIKDNKLLFKKALQRPNECHVSNDGIVVCCDWLNTEELKGSLIIFSSSGEQVFSYTATANLGACGISNDSSVAVFETYGSETEDTNSVFIIDITEKKIINKFARPHAFNKVQIDSKGRRLSLIDHRGFRFKVDFMGDQTNRDEYEKQILTKGSVYDKLSLYESKSDAGRLTDNKYLKLLIQALDDKDASYAFGKDKIYRKLGEYYEANGDVAKTIESWEKAVQLNSKVGVKRKLEALKKA